MKRQFLVQPKQSVEANTQDKRLAHGNQRYKGYRISMDHKNLCWNIYDSRGELEDAGFKSIDDAKLMIDKLVSAEGSNDVYSASGGPAHDAIEVDEDKAHDVAVDIINGVWDDQINGRDEDIEWMYESADELAEDIPAILYLLFGLEDGEDYQLMNGTSIMYTDTANGLWKQAKTLLS